MQKLVLMIATLGMALTAHAEWTAQADVPRTRAEHDAVLVGDKIYVLSGLNENQNTGPSEIDRYDPATDTWNAAYGTMSRNKNHSGVVAYQDRYIVLVGGKTAGPTTGVRWVDQYDTVNNTWSQLPDLPTTVWAAPAVMVGNYVHIFSGAVNNSNSATHHFRLNLQNPSSGWESMADIPTAVVHAGAVVFNNMVYLIAGETRHSHPSNGQLGIVQIYNPATNQWSSGPNIPIARNHIETSVFVYDNKIWSVTGVDSSNNPRGQDEVLTFDGNSWADAEMDLPEKKVGASALATNDTLFVMGGWVNTWIPSNLTRRTYAYVLNDTSPPAPRPEAPIDFLVE